MHGRAGLGRILPFVKHAISLTFPCQDVFFGRLISPTRKYLDEQMRETVQFCYSVRPSYPLQEEKQARLLLLHPLHLSSSSSSSFSCPSSSLSSDPSSSTDDFQFGLCARTHETHSKENVPIDAPSNPHRGVAKVLLKSVL